MTEPARIPIPFAQRVRRFRFTVLPALSFALCVLFTLWMWRNQTQQPHTLGEVEVVRIDLAAGADGRLKALELDLGRGPDGTQITVQRPHWTLFDRVKEGDVIARIDEASVQAQVSIFRADLERISRELTAAEEQFALEHDARQVDHQQQAHRLAWQIQLHRLDILDRKALIETDRVDLMRLDERLSYLNQLQGNNVIAEMDLVEERLLRDTVLKRIQENEKGWGEAERQRKWAIERMKDFGDARTADIQKLVAPFEAAIAVQDARLDELRVQIEGLQIRAPFDGTIAMIHAWPGQYVRMGDPIVTLADDHGRYIVSYVRQAQRLRPTVGTEVAIRPRLPGAKPVIGVVGRVGPQVELIPPHQRRDPAVLEWGLPVRIELPDGLAVTPGELVDIRFGRRPADAG